MSERVTGQDAGADVAPASPSLSAVWIAEYKQDYIRYRPVVLTLPSGKPVKVARLPLHVMWTRGLIPDRLTAQVTAWIDTIEAGDAEKAREKVMADFKDPEKQAQALKDWMDMLDFVFVTAVQEPRFVYTEDEQDIDEGILWVEKVDYLDKSFIFNWAQGVDQSVEDFFREAWASLGAVADVLGVELPSEPNAGGDAAGGRVAGVPDGSSDVRVGPVHPKQNRRARVGADRHQAQAQADGAEAEVQPGADRGDALRRPVSMDDIRTWNKKHARRAATTRGH